MLVVKRDLNGSQESSMNKLQEQIEELKAQRDIPIECEKCKTIVYYRRPGSRNTYVRWVEGSMQFGLSEKYGSKLLGGYCYRHSAARVLGRIGGKAKTPAKISASKKNGKKGGRPKNP